MENVINIAASGHEDEIFLINIIEENSISEDMLCNSLGCA